MEPELLLEEEGDFPSGNFSFSLWPSASSLLVKAEKDLLQEIQSKYKQSFIPISNNLLVNTLEFASNGGPPLLLVHGYGSGVGQWIKNFDHLTKFYKVYACDIVGFGRSSRPEKEFLSPEDAELFFTNCLHEWIQALKLDFFFLCGHSLGAYISTIYQIKYKNSNCHLILVDPWGFPKVPEEYDPSKLSWKWSIVHSVSDRVTPFSILRYAGPFGKSLMGYFRDDLISKFEHFSNPNMFIDYLYHANSQSPSPGEDAFQMLKIPFAWAKLPLVERFHELDEKLRVTFIYGADTHTWVKVETFYELREKYKNKRNITVIEIEEAGHHVMLDNEKDFNNIMERIYQSHMQRLKKQQKK
jgi:pimeloyl-ACP methyl ester carboxylesterase